MAVFERITATAAPRATILIRFVVGLVFLSEGIQKFLYRDEVGAGRFARIGIPNPELSAPLVGTFEVVCGAFLIAGLLTRIAVVPLIVIMLSAIVSTKIPILLGSEFLGFGLRKVSYYGVWGMLHESRTDLAMLFGSIFLLIVGAGKFSIDAVLSGRKKLIENEN